MDASAYHEQFARLSANERHDLITDAIRSATYDDEQLAALCGIDVAEIVRIRYMGPRDRRCDRP